MRLITGQTLNNRYRIVQLLGQGGFGAVYRAWDLNLKRPCAVKENFDASPQATQQFEQEALILANLSHPNLPRVTDHFVLSGQGQYLVMDFVEGDDLQTKINQAGKLPEHEVLPWIEQVCDALTYLHRQSPPIIHRDIKPANIRITPNGQALLVDFGIAKRYDPQSKTTLGAQAVTPGFSPPEQYGKGGTDARSDVYALGATLYTALTGKEPVESVQRTTGISLPAPRQFNANLSSALEITVLTALSLLPGDRYASAAAFKQALQPTTALGISGGLPKIFGNVTTTKPLPASIPKFPNTWIVGGIIAILGLFSVVILALGIMKNNSSPSISPTAPTPTVTIVAETPVPPASATPDRPGTQLVEAVKQTDEANLTGAASLAARETALASGFLTQTAAPTLQPEPTNTHTPGIGGTRLSPVDGMVMVFIPAGEFLMGSTEQDLAEMLGLCPGCSLDSISDQVPQRHISLDAYWLDRTEVTNAQFAQFVAETGYVTQAERESGAIAWDASKGKLVYTQGANWEHPEGPDSTLAGRETHPVRQVSWDDANAYCQWVGRRLPTEAEWEKAARGTDGRFFPWGNSSPTNQLLNFNLSVRNTTAVGSYPAGASPYGALDMAGNVWEWVADFYLNEYYSEMPDRNPSGPTSAQYHSLRGGSWASEYGSELVYVMSTYRFANYPYFRSGVLGFRCAMDAEDTHPSTPLVISTPTPVPLVYEFFTCQEPCQPNGMNATRTFPEGTTTIYLHWGYANIPTGAHYVREWNSNGELWVRYDCAWDGPTADVDNITLTEPGGLRSGVWEVTIKVDEVVLLRETITVVGNWNFWAPAGPFDTCYGKN